MPGRFFFGCKGGKQGAAAGGDIPVGAGKVPAVPRVGHIAAVGIVQQLFDLMLRVAAQHTVQITHIVAIHGQQQIIVVIIGNSQLSSALAVTGQTVGSQLCLGRRVHRIAFSVPNLFSAGGSGRNLKLICQSHLPHHILKDEFRHRRAANVAVAHEQNAYWPIRYAHSASLAKMASAASAVGAVSEKLLSRAVSSTTPFFRFRGLTITRRGTPSRSASENITPALTERSS